MPRIIKYQIDDEFDGKKVIHYLRGHAKLSARLVNSLKRVPMGITLNGEHIRTIDRLKSGDELVVSIPDEKTELEKVDGELQILYEDEDLLIINKSPFMAMHPTHNHQGDTLANLVASYLDGTSVFRAIGRLDKGTSGAVICAKNSHSANLLSGNVRKEYIALVSKALEGSGTIDVPIYRPDPMKTLRACGENGDKAVTHWETIKSNGEISLVRLKLETGRTHQIRVHFAHIGASLLGDTMYGQEYKGIKHQLLHCEKLEFDHPITKERIYIKAPVFEDMRQIIDEF